MSVDDDEDLKELQRAHARRMWTLRLAGAAIVVGFVGMIVWNFTAPLRHRAKDRLTDAEAADFGASMAAALKVVADEEAFWAEETTPERLAALLVTDSACPLDLQPPTTTAVDSYLKYGSIDVNYIGNVGFTRLKPGESFGACDDCTMAREAIQRGLDELERGDLGRREARWLSRYEDGADGWAIFVVADEWKDPEEVGATFEPGFVRGRAYVYDHSEHRVVCVTDLDVESSPTVKGYYTERLDAIGGSTRRQGMQKALKFDLEVQVKRAIARTSVWVAAYGDDTLGE